MLIYSLYQVFSSVNIEDSKQMKGLTQATVRDSAAMKQIAYLTMVFLPASFAAVCLDLLYTCLMQLLTTSHRASLV